MSKQQTEHLNLTLFSFTCKQKQIVKALYEYGPLTRGVKGGYANKDGANTLLSITKIPRTTLIDNLNKLKEKNLVKKFEKHTGRQGRPFKYWDLTKQFRKELEDVQEQNPENSDPRCPGSGSEVSEARQHGHHELNKTNKNNKPNQE
jgi:DNA-binding PadR family transcriptional regulator